MLECMVLLLLYDNHVCMFLIPSIFLQSICMYMFMGLVAWMVNGMVASSSPVGGLGTLQTGIKAHVTAWA